EVLMPSNESVKITKGLLFLILWSWIGVSTASAQSSGSISGTVKDSSGGVMPGVSVTATNVALGTQFSATTDTQGLYARPKLPVGRYDFLFQIDGFKPQRRAALAVDADADLQVNATLEVGEQSETVTVTADQVRVETLSTQLGEVVPATTMTTL